MNLQELKEELAKAKSSYKLPYENAEGADKILMPKPDTFEVVLSRKGEKYLLPVSINYQFLYRGQDKEYIPCLPTIYRGSPSEVEIFANRMYQVEFSMLIDTHPVVRGFYKRHGFHIDYEGLAQHYGLKTEVLDFTDSLDIALFFAMCPYDPIQKHYTWHNDNQEHQAIIYLVRPFLDYMQIGKFDLSDKLNPIGMQPFSRPRVQRGFAIHVPNNELFRPVLVDFSYTSKDSKDYYDKFNQGNSLWIQDILSLKSEELLLKSSFSNEVFNRTWEKYRPKGYSKTKLRKALILNGINISRKIKNITFSEEEKINIISIWDKEAPDVKQKICRRYWYEEIKDGKCKGFHPYRSQKVILEEETMRSILSAGNNGFSCPGRYVRYNEPTTPPKRKDNIKGEWKKNEAQACAVQAKPFLTDEEMLLKL